MRWLDGITDSIEFEQVPGVDDGQEAWRAAVHKELDMTKLLY